MEGSAGWGWNARENWSSAPPWSAGQGWDAWGWRRRQSDLSRSRHVWGADQWESLCHHCQPARPRVTSSAGLRAPGWAAERQPPPSGQIYFSCSAALARPSDCGEERSGTWMMMTCPTCWTMTCQYTWSGSWTLATPTSAWESESGIGPSGDCRSSGSCASWAGSCRNGCNCRSCRSPHGCSSCPGGSSLAHDAG